MTDTEKPGVGARLLALLLAVIGAFVVIPILYMLLFALTGGGDV